MEILAKYDTIAKTFEVTIDGKAVADAKMVEIFPSWDDEKKSRCCVTSWAENKDDGVTVMTRVQASEQATPSKAHAGMFETKTTRPKAVSLDTLFGK